ncbi:MAG TPA: DUF4175 family protein [Daejeonella sp.]|nr:DUF4175 family protein [Daejeonella sp.]
MGKKYILAIRRAWRFNLVVAGILIAVGCTAVVISLSYRISDISLFWALPLFTAIFFLLFRIENRWNVSSLDVSRFLNKRFPELEESSQLFLKPKDSLSFLEKIQSAKIEHRIPQLPVIKHRVLQTRIVVFLCCLVVTAAIWLIPASGGKVASRANQEVNRNSLNADGAVLPAKVQSAKVTIIPPAYTRKASRDQREFSLTAEEGAQVLWRVETSEPVNSLSFVFNDKEKISLQAINKEKTLWQLRKVIRHPGFYQVKIDDRLSDLYQLQTIQDQPPFIRIITPEQYSTIDFGEPQRTLVNVSVSDDYGIRNGVIMATIASGKGEGVKFKEQQISFQSDFKSLKRKYDLQKTIDLRALGMVPGDELYFYVKALDNFNQESRSESYFVSIADTAELMSMDGMTSGVNLVPEYFRSMRQIIIDTEKLIKDRPAISTAEFNSRSNNLGIDQKLLRLRYGKFLGEEGGEEDHEEHSEDEPATFGNADAILNKYGHNHDNAEDATFFEPELKSQLKATLTEMWNSELRLRTNKPSEALPYEYKALRLLKDLQQKSRVYVAKTAIKTPMLKKETRLSGELDKIINPFNKRKLPAGSNAQDALRETPEVLYKLKHQEKLNSNDLRILSEANKTLSSKAAANPSFYLGAVAALRKIIRTGGNSVKSTDLILIEKALQRAVTGTVELPQSPPDDGTSNLSDLYFKNLNQLRQ